MKINNEKINLPLKGKHKAEYKAMLKKALPNFEKAMACDPNNQFSASIKNIFGTLKDNNSVNSLVAKLAVLSKECVDFLSED